MILHDLICLCKRSDLVAIGVRIDGQYPAKGISAWRSPLRHSRFGDEAQTRLTSLQQGIHLLTALILLATSASAQSFKVQGTISDTSNNKLELATAILITQADSVIFGFSITNAKGLFRIRDIPKGEYFLTITYLGYSDIIRDIEIDQEINLGNLIMKPESSKLADVTISALPIPIRIKKDTIEYNADAFKVNPADNVEELLKKLPGVEVENDGTIKAQGEEVQNVFVDGKEFFSSDPTIATKNLPADVVDIIQVYDKSSDMAEFSGIDDGEREKTLNLVLKEGKKAGYFGSASAGYGTDRRYEGKLSLNRFTKETQLSAIGMLNNTNKQGFSFREYIDFMGGLGNLAGGGGQGRSGTNSLGLPISQGLGNGFVQTGAGGLNYNIEPVKDVEINSSYFFNRIKNDITQTITRLTLVENGGFDTEQEANLINENYNHTANSTIRATLDSTQKIITRLSFGWNEGSSMSLSHSRNFDENGVLQSSGFYDNKSSGDKLESSINMTYMKRLKKKGRFFSANGRFSLSDNNQFANLNSTNTLTRNGSTSIDTLLQEQTQENQQARYSFKISITEPLGKRRYLELNASRSSIDYDFKKDYFDVIDPLTNRLEYDEILSDAYNQDYSYNRIGANIKFNSNNASLTAGGHLQHSDLNGILQSQESPINQDYIYFLPSLTWNYDIGTSKSLRVRYHTSINEPDIDQLQPLVDNSDPLNIYIGNPDLRPAYRHNLNINFNSFSQFSNVGFFARANARYTKNNITNTRRVDRFFVQTTTPVNTDYAFNSSLYFNLNAPLRFIRQRISLSNNLMFSDNILFVNSTENKVKRVNDRISLALDNMKKDVADLRFGTNISINSTSYSQSKEQNQNYLDSEYFIDLDIDLPNDWNFNTFLRHNIYSEEDFGEQISLSRWKASLSKIFGQTKKLRAELTVFDILNQNQNINRTTNLNYIQDERMESIGRYILVSLSYSFSGFGKRDWFGGRGRRRG